MNPAKWDYRRIWVRLSKRHAGAVLLVERAVLLVERAVLLVERAVLLVERAVLLVEPVETNCSNATGSGV